MMLLNWMINSYLIYSLRFRLPKSGIFFYVSSEIVYRNRKEGPEEVRNRMQYTDPMKNRVKRMEGQLRGILKMMEEDKDCKEVITQLSAVRSAVDRTIGVIVSTNLLECVQKADGDSEKMDEIIKEAMNLVVKSR